MPRVIDHAAREVEVAEAAWRVLRARGTRGISVRTVATEAGLAIGSVRRSFPTQQALLAYCIRLVAQRVSERIAAREPDPDPVEHAVGVLAETLPLDEQRRVEAEVWLALSIGSLSDAELRVECDAVDASLARLSSTVVRELHGADVIAPSLDLTVEAARLHALVDGLAVHLIRQPPDADTGWAADVVRRHLDSLRRT